MISHHHRILEARENRASIRSQFADKGWASVSLTLNIPGYPKSNSATSSFFRQIKEQLIFYFQSVYPIFNVESEIHLTDEAGEFFIIGFVADENLAAIMKKLGEIFENLIPVGRIIDIDVCDRNGQFISSNKLKKCFVCEHSAIECMHNKNHKIEDLRSYIFKEIQSYNSNKKSQLTHQLSLYASIGILKEISLSSKPGLVSPNDNGIHEDMDYFTFLESTTAIAPYFYVMAEKGVEFTGDLSKALETIRETGLLMEKEMFKATQNVNTQKGIVFLMGISLFAAAYQIGKDRAFQQNSFQQIIKELSKDLLREFDGEAKTHGIICAQKYGVEIGGGARYEAYSGMNTALKFGYSIFEKRGDIDEQATRATLLSIMAHNNDTNVLFRSDLATLKILKQKAKNSLFTEGLIDENYRDLQSFCKSNNVSPGGSADLLAISIYIYLIKKNFKNGL